MNEFDFLKKLKQNFKFDLAGDDCAVLPSANGHDLLVTADMLVEGIDFRLEWAPTESVGHKSLAVSLSDIAAMGGEANWALISMGIPDRLWDQDFLFAFYNGINGLAQEFGVRIAGGDISRCPERLVIDSIVLGSCPSNSAVLRSGAREGELICVSGPLGGAAGGLRILESKARVNTEKGIDSQDPISRQLKPTPQLVLGNMLRVSKLATSMIDLSDGFSSDLRHICEQSGKGAVVYGEKVPIDPCLEKIDPDILLPFGSPLDAALNGGEDFELLFTAPAEKRKDVEDLGCFVVGEIVSDPSTFEMIVEGTGCRLDAAGYDHFRDKP
ncbi:MAG: thiamine-phosphate kinase [Aridibacter famidurans]|nr:thiamine-phosphate kinase [Aridibacter famidurans]